MESYEQLNKYDLLTKVYLINTEFGGRQGAVLDGYRGQFFWHINDVNCSDWDAEYCFINGAVNPGEESLCKIRLSENVKNIQKVFFRLIGSLEFERAQKL